MNFTEQLLSQAFKLAQNPHVSRVLQNPEVMGNVVKAMQLGVNVASQVGATRDALLRSLNLATLDDVQALQRRVRDLQEQLEAQDSSSSAKNPR